MISRAQIASRRHIMPGRVTVSVLHRLPRDVFASGIDVLAERRPVGKRKQRSGDGESHGDTYEYVFWTVELEAVGAVVKEGNVIQDGALFVSVDEVRIELQGQRQRAFCSLSIDPATVID